jgi:MarR family 2-MHQ and catechol resistance regulon transcriptional repressor
VAKDSPLDDPLITTFGRLVEASDRLQRSVGQVLAERSTLPLGWFEVLLRLARSDDGRMTMGELAGQIVLTTGGVTRLIDRMESAGVVVREPCPTDRRVSYAVITEEGLAKVEQAAGVHAVELRDVFAGFSARELGTLDRLLDRLRATPGS